MSGLAATFNDRRFLVSACAGAAVGLWFLKSRRRSRSAQMELMPTTPMPGTPRSPGRSLSLMSLQNALSQDVGTEKRSVTVMVPATSANMGSGYDTIGMAVDMWNEVTLERAESFSIHVEGEGAEDIPLDEGNLVVVGVKAVYEAIGVKMPPLRYRLKQRIPHGRGLGSSSAAIVGGLLAGLALAGRKLDIVGSEKLLQLALQIEGHPDNVAPALYGGIQLGIFSQSKNRWMTSRVPLPHGLIFVIFIPEFTGKTSELRRVVPKTIPMADAVFNMGRLAWLVNCLLTGKMDVMREGFEDRLHQNQRAAAVYKYLNPMIDAAYKAGAVGAYLSGSGPCVMAITRGGFGDFFTQADSEDRKDRPVAEAMQKVAAKMNIKGKVFITHPAHNGGVVAAADPPFSSDLLAFNGFI